MRITRIDFEGKRGHYATAQRRVGAGNAPNVVVVTILTPDQPNGREHHVLADCEDDLRSMAECLQHHLDGCRGTNSDVYGYYAELLRLSDI
ncbi:MAG TPA: hypothetical protein PKG77_24020 [Phycisphaerae bacterium]|nr:hypothetical protein [Phycisphaerae bacterium]HQL76331.1 hypothetical protein [Phycisphaerae bacterium]